MALDIGSTGVYRPIVKYNAQSARWYLRSGDHETEIDLPTMVMDLENIALGWVLFLAGSAPNCRWDTTLEVRSPQPSDSHKRGFLVVCYSPKYLDGVAELSSGSMHISNSIKELYTTFEEQRGNHPGKVPVVACTGTTAVDDKFGTNHKPAFEIVDWADRPEDLPDESPVDPSEVWNGGGGVAAAPRPTRADHASDAPAKSAASDEPASKATALF